MGDWTAEAQAAIDMCASWASNVPQAICADLFLFGSAIYKAGEQFDPLSSDLDIIAVFSSATSPGDRVKCLLELLQAKQRLELSLIPTLGRAMCDEPAVSVVPVTRFEIMANIHKSGARRFFDKNTFFSLRDGQIALGLADAATLMIPDENRSALEYVQGVRSKYLSRAANLTGGLSSYAGSDPMPKALLRFAAQLSRGAVDGEWYDTRHGLELMFDKLRERRLEDEDLQTLFDLISVRRGGRGSKRSLTNVDQLLLSELLFDIASDVKADDVAVWEIRFSRASGLTPADETRIKSLIGRLVPDGSVIDIRSGSLIIRLRSSLSSLKLINRLSKLDVLSALFDVDAVELATLDVQINAATASFPRDREQQLLDLISAWRPKGGLRERLLGDSLYEWLSSVELHRPHDRDFLMFRDIPIEHSGRQLRPDFVISWKEDGDVDLVALELKQLRSRREFVQTAERLLDMPFRVYLVIVASKELVESVNDDIKRLGRTVGKLKVITVLYGG